MWGRRPKGGNVDELSPRSRWGVDGVAERARSWALRKIDGRPRGKPWRSGASLPKLGHPARIGAACHAGGRGFESRRSRSKEPLLRRGFVPSDSRSSPPSGSRRAANGADRAGGACRGRARGPDACFATGQPTRLRWTVRHTTPGPRHRSRDDQSSTSRFSESARVASRWARSSRARRTRSKEPRTRCP